MSVLRAVNDKLNQDGKKVLDIAKSPKQSLLNALTPKDKKNDNLGLKSMRGAIHTASLAGTTLGKAGLRVASNVVAGHWHESGLSQIFGHLPGWETTKEGILQRKSKTGTGEAGSLKSSAALASISRSLQDLITSTNNNSNELSGLRKDVQHMHVDIVKGLGMIYQAILNSATQAKDPFAEQASRRNKSLSHPTLAITDQSKKGGSKGLLGGLLGGALGLLSSLFGKNGSVLGGLSSILGVAKGIAKVIGVLSAGVGALVKFGLKMAGTLGTMVASVMKSARSALGRLGTALKDWFRGKPTVEPVKPPVPQLEPPKPTVEPNVEGKPTVEAEAKPVTEPEAKPTPSEEPSPRRAPTTEEHGNAESQAEPRARATETPVDNALKDTETRLNNAEAKAPSTVEAKPTTEVPKPVEAPKAIPESTPSGAVAESVVEGGVKEVVKDAAKVATKTTLMGALTKAGGASLIGIIEAFDGFTAWADAYDKFKDGKMSEQEFKKVQSEIIGKAVGATAGGAIGGMIGAGIGLATGPAAPVAAPLLGALGAYAGSWIGGSSGQGVGEAVFKTLQKERNGNGVEGNATAQQPRPAQNVTANPTTTVPAERMIQGSEQQASRNRSPTIINAPTTNHNVTNNSSGGGSGGSSSMSPGNARPSYDGLDHNANGLSIPLMP